MNEAEIRLRPVEIWVPDTSRPGFVEECKRQCLLLQDNAPDRETTDWLQAAADTDGWLSLSV